MKFFSTRDHSRIVTASQAIAQGLSDEGGLFVPESFPQVDVEALCQLDYPELAAAVVSEYLTDYSKDFLAEAARTTYGEAFGGKAGYLAPVEGDTYALELWHGPTCAFKDYALQLMPKLLVEAKKNLSRTEKTLILVATSGDTGKAALDGYHDIPGVEIAVFYPTGGTSEIQRLQMATQEGANVAVYAVRGNFDDAQTGVKKVFGDKAIAARLAERNIRLSSANSINWGRLVPQIVYYFAAYAQLLKAGKISFGDKVDFCVPTGNFGDILAGYYAKQMGLPVGKLVGGLLGKMLGKAGRTIGSVATGSAFSFASTYALGQVARRYYAGGRTLSGDALKSSFSGLVGEARELQQRYAPQIEERARTLDVGKLMNELRV